MKFQHEGPKRLVSVLVAWVVLSQLLNLLLRHASSLVILLAFDLGLVASAEVEPHEEVDESRHGNQGHGHGVAADEARGVVG